ncbi:MAG: bifunctional NAD(P)/FAD-dependent oxidoreductase/class I SAM-dependent methyltransferase [Acidimicrobiales bacterium]|nr:bifunctional NAD(P)/FAD-dependent oxidoreductase/class I SAM-dependent methyltransferase [Acidimicrobiales bacterium]
MSEHTPHSIERHGDVLVVGGSAAGLAAALQLGRQRRSVMVVDAGEPRNAPAAAMHGFLGRDATPPSELIGVGREEVRSYGGEVLSGRVVELTRHDRGFRADLVGGHSVVARHVVIATGIVDVLPDIDGVADQWGRGVIHCPFCHGYEVRDRRIVQIVTHPMGLHSAPLFRQLSDRLTVVVHEPADIDRADLDALDAAGVEIVERWVARVVTGPTGEISGVELASGEVLDADAVVVGPRFAAATAPFERVGVAAAPHPSGLGTAVEVDELGATSVPGVWAAGNVTDPSQQVIQAAAAGARVGAMVAFALAQEDLAADGRPSSNEVDWDRRYAGDRLWSGNPNGALVTELDGVAPGTALDVGSGEGGDAIWLAEQGWTVTASDISTTALAVVAAEADRRGLPIECLHADANAIDAYGSRRFDLVSAHYASIPRTADDRGLHNLLDAVAPGGTLLVVSHDITPMRHPVDTTTVSRVFDPDAYLRVEDVEAVVRSSPSWTIEVHETRPRPPGAASAHHVDDVVLRARRHPR